VTYKIESCAHPHHSAGLLGQKIRTFCAGAGRDGAAARARSSPANWQERRRGRAGRSAAPLRLRPPADQTAGRSRALRRPGRPVPRFLVGSLLYSQPVPKAPPLAAVALLNLEAAGDKKLKAMKHAADAVEPVWALAYARHKLDHWPTQAEYAAFWKISDRKAQHEWAAFRRAFPGEETPLRIAKLFYAEVGRRVEDHSTALSTAVPELVPA
jgi:hypothetical protein